MSTHPTQRPEGRLAALRSRPYARAFSLFALLFALGLPAVSWLDVPFAHTFRALCTLALAPVTFGQGGHAQFVASAPKFSLERAASWDVSMVLRIEGVAAEHAIALNPRRLLYLPLLTLLSCVLAAPLPLRARRMALFVGVPALVLLALLSVWLIAVFLFARVPGLVYTLAPWQASALRVAYEGWVTPLTNKFVVPLLLAAALLSWQSRQNTKPIPSPARSSKGETERPEAPPAQHASSSRRKQRSQKRGTSRKGQTSARRT